MVLVQHHTKRVVIDTRIIYKSDIINCIPYNKTYGQNIIKSYYIHSNSSIFSYYRYVGIYSPMIIYEAIIT